MGSTRCRHFVQNAWKKDLCSNCFKSKDEHEAAAPARARHRQAVLPAPTGPPPQSILKGGSRTRVGKAHRVYFPAEESEVIGEGGEDAGPPSDDDSDDQADADWGPTPVEDDPQEREEERLLQALTRSNTDFNSVAANLEGNAPPPASNKATKQKSTAPLQLGRTQTDSAGRKQTLLVTVQPFGKPAGTGPAAPTPAAPVSNGDHVTKIPVATPPSNATTDGDVVLKSIVHTGDELPPIKSPAKQSPAKQSPAKSPVKSVTTTTVPSAAPAPAPAPAAAGATSPTLLKLNDAQETAVAVAAAPPSPAPLSSKHMFLKSIVEPAADAVSSGGDPATSVGSVATGASPPVSSSSPVSLTAVTASTAKAGSPLKTSTNLAKAATSPVKQAAVGTVKPAVSASTTTVTAVPAAPAVTTTTTTTTSSARREGKRTHITRGTPISKNNELMLKTKLIPLRTATILSNSNNKRNAYGQREEETSMVKINGSRSEPVMLIESKQLDSSDEDERTYSNVQVQSPAGKRLAGDESPGAQTKRLAGLLAPLAPVGSRELAGEPDGRADPDSSSESGSEPPALPQSPPPAVDPRPSFLHGLTARLSQGLSQGLSPVSSPCLPLADKPRVPFKSSTVVQAAVQQQQQLQKALAPAEPPQAPSCSPPSSNESSPTSSPSSSPHGTPLAGLDGCSRQQKRQAPQPPQEQLYATPPPPASKDTATPMRPALGRSASTGSSTSSPSPTPSPSASPPSPGLSYHRKASTTASVKDSKRRSSQHLFSMAPLPPLAPSRSESVPSGLAQVALGHSVTLGAHSGQSIAQALAQANSFVSMSPSPSTPGQPQPSPRRALSLSTDSLSGGSPPKHVMSYDTERKKPGTKVRFSLRKFLGLSKEGMRSEVAGHAPEGPLFSGAPSEPPAPPQPRPRPRLEIIHPSDLSGRAVEVLRASGVEVRRQMQEQAAQQAQQQAQQVSGSRRSSDSTILGDVPASPQPQGGLCFSTDGSGDVAKARPSKPPPPPRSQSLENDLSHGALGSPSRPSRPPPPKAAHVDLMMRRHSSTAAGTAPAPAPASSPAPPGHSVYANIAVGVSSGEVRTAPLKPQRTGSVRDSAADSPRRAPGPLEASPVSAAGAGTGTVPGPEQKTKAPPRTCSLSSQPEDSGYESVELSDSTQPQSMTDSDNVYECVNGAPERSSSPECDSKRVAVNGVGEADSGGGAAGSGGVDRPSSVSAQYCGSETESDIYSPYSFYGSEEGDDGDTDASATWKWRSRARKGRSVVHKSMEENYGAVVSANLEALAQLLEQIRTGPAVPPALRPLKTASGLSWSDFTVDAPQVGVAAGRWVFLAAQWGCHAVTLGVLPAGQGQDAPRRGRGTGPLPFALLPIVEFTGQVPTACMASLPGAQRPAGSHVQALVGVLARARVDTLASYGSWLRGAPLQDSDGEAAWRDAGLALLQLLNALLVLQNMREAADPDSVVLLRGEASASAQTLDGTPQLSLLPGATPAAPTDAAVSRSLCQCALAGARALLPDAPPAPLLTSLLSEVEDSTLSRAKAVLEYWLWGPSEAVPSMAALQRWLDLERATVLHRLVCARAAAGPSHRLAIQQQSHLLFLVHTSASAMADASRLLDTAGVVPLESAS